MKTRISVVILGVFVLGVLGMAGCANRPGTTSPAFVAPQLGIVADEKLRVIEVRPGNAAEAAGLQVGDVLLDLTWIPSDAPAYVPEGSDVVYPDAAITPVDSQSIVDAAGNAFASPLLPSPVPPIPPPVESYIDKGTVSFTEVDRIRSLITYGVPLKLRLMRGDQMLELTIVPIVPPPRPSLAPGEVRPTRTPLPQTYYYY